VKIFIDCAVADGGVAEHAHYQAQALSEGHEVLMLCPRGFLGGRPAAYRKAEIYAPKLPEDCGRQTWLGRWRRVLHAVARIAWHPWQLAWQVARHRPQVVLVACYSEYLAPLWVWPHWLLARCGGVTYVANLHDPVRDYQVGPKWWHELSVRMAYWPISVGVVHEKLPEPSPVPRHVRVVEAPVGVYEFSDEPGDRVEIRAEWGVPEEACVFFAFGFIRDNKNLDLVVRALASCPQAWLVVMGRSSLRKDKPMAFYEQLAREVGVAERTRFLDAFVPDAKLASYFAAADVVVLTYNASFRSQSGVLNIAARARRPVLASAGESPLKTCVEKFRLGVFVAPDDLEAVREGMERVMSGEWRVKQPGAAVFRKTGVSEDRYSEVSGQRSEAGGRCSGGSVFQEGKDERGMGADWEGYEAFASWRTNAEVIVAAIRELRAGRDA